MKTLGTYIAAGFMLVGLTACSSSKVKDQTDLRAPSSDTVVDAGLNPVEPVKVKGGNVIDAGVYRENEDYTDLVKHGGKNGSVVPTERFYTMDREKIVPTDKVLYILSEDSPAHCMKGKSIGMEVKKRLVVYTKSLVPSSYCIYQKSFSSDAEGFSIFATNGGMCKPSFTSVKVDDQKRKMASVEPVNNTVSMAYCVDHTMSYGEYLAGHQ
jgi:hypothetical protein